jgi:subtilase family serine protease
MSKMRVRLWCVAALTAASLVLAGGAAVPVFASSHTEPDLGTPPHLLIGPAASFVAPAFGRVAPTCPSSDGSRITCYSPAFVQQAYDYPTGYNAPTGAGQTIVIVDPYGSPTINADVKAFDTAFGIAPVSLTIDAPNGSGDQSDPDASYWSAETSLDVEWAHAMAPGASIVLAVAPTDNADDIVATEAAVLPQYPRAIVSESFGVDENDPDPDTQAFITALHSLYQSSPRNTVIASAGDYGATDDTDTIVAAYPASDPLVLGVGGAQGQPYPDGLWSRRGGYGGEAVWNESQQGDFYGATGGAPSILFPAPSWQWRFSHNAARTVPDVSYDAAIDGGVIVFDGPEVYTAGGTSIGPPQWAGIIALADQLRSRAGQPPLGDGADAALYGIAGNGWEYANDFHDITQGNNILVDQSLGFQAGRGYDLASGLGTPDVANLIGDLAHGSFQQFGRDDDGYFGNHNGSFGRGGRSRGGHVSPSG